MTTPSIGLLIEQIGQLIADLLPENNANEVFMYALVGDMWQETAIFHDLGNQVVFHFPSLELSEAIQELWELEEPEKKWSMLYYTISAGKFTADFLYPDDIDPEEDSFERRQRIVAERYGEKPVDYSEPRGIDHSN